MAETADLSNAASDPASAAPSRAPRSTAQDKTASAAQGTAERAIDGERRSFEQATGAGARTAGAGLRTAQDMARQGADATRRVADEGRRAGLQMASAWRDAFDPMFRVQMDATRWFDETWRQLTGLAAFPGLQTARPFALSPAPLFGAPAVDVRETDQAYEIVVETPGVAREDLDVRLDGDVLTVSGQKLDSNEQANAAYRVSERRFGRFARSFPIPPDARREGIEAMHKDGVLTVRLPKAEETRQNTSRIEIR